MTSTSASRAVEPLDRPSSPLQTFREALRLLLTAADAYVRQRLLLALVLVTAGALLAGLAPIALKLAVDALGSRPEAWLITPIAWVVFYAAGQFLSRACAELRQFLNGLAEQRIRRQVGRRLFEHLVRLPLSFHLERKTGAMGETAEQGIRGLQLLQYHAVYTVLPVTIEFLTVAGVLIHFGHAAYIGILALSAICYVAVFHRGAASIHDPARRVSQAHIDAHAILTDSLINHETIKYFDAESVVCQRYDLALGRSESAWRTFFTRRAVNGLLVAVIFATSLGVSLAFAAHDVLRGAMTVGDFVLVNTYVVRLVQPLELMGYAVRDVAQGLAFLRSMLDLLLERIEPGLPRPSVSTCAAHAELAFEHVSFSYHAERPVLRDVSFRVPPGRMVAVVGASGSGKSSLIRLLFRLYEPDAGRILIDGVPIADMPLTDLRRAIAVVPQDTVLFHDTIARNISFGRLGAGMREIEEAARVASLHEFVMNLPEQYETVVGERGLKLSGGERQRVAIARAVLKQPRILVFDEATSSLDTETEAKITRSMSNLASHHTTLVIAHRLSTIMHADIIVVMDEGRVIEAGSHASLHARSGRYANMLTATRR